MRQLFTVEKDPYTASGALKLERNYPVETLIALTLMFGCLLGFLWVTLALYDACYFQGSPNFRAAVPAIAAAGVVPWLSYTSHPYDFVSLLLFASILLLIQRSAWKAYLIVFTLACINKETAILNTLVFATYFAAQRRVWTRLSLTLIGIQVAIFTALHLIIDYAFRNNPGVNVEIHLFDINLPMMQQWIRRPYGVEQLVTALIIGIALFYRWRDKPLVPRSALVIAVPFALMWPYVGVLNEWRAYTDLYPPMLLLILGSIGYLFGVRPRANVALPMQCLASQTA
jgi:hypothetical protein